MLLRKVSLIATIFVLSLSVKPVWATPIFNDDSQQLEIAQMNCQGGDDKKNRGNFMSQLNLTETQKTQLETIKKNYANKVKPIRDQLKTKESELSNLMVNNSSNDLLTNKHKEIQQLRQQMGNLHFENMLEIRSILTPEQRSKYGQMMEYRRGGK